MICDLDFKLWLDKSLALYEKGMEPEDVLWEEIFSIHPFRKSEVQTSFFAKKWTPEDLKPSKKILRCLEERETFSEFRYEVSTALAHQNPERFKILYFYLKNYIKDENVFFNPLKKSSLTQLKRQVSRDIHKMHAFVRFHEQENGGQKFFVAYHKPDHFILRKTASFFKDRFQNMNWVIVTPYAMMAWNQKQIFYQEGDFKEIKFKRDSFTNLWTKYFENIFNPARVKVRAMKNEMPVRYWSTLPEAESIKDLIRQAPKRVEEMRQNALQADSLGLHKKISSATHLRDLHKALKDFHLSENGEAALLGEFKLSSVPSPVLVILRSPLESFKVADEIKKKLNITYAVRSVPKAHSKKSFSAHELLFFREALLKEVSFLNIKMILCVGAQAAHALVGLPQKKSNRVKKLEFAIPSYQLPEDSYEHFMSRALTVVQNTKSLPTS